MWNHFVNQGFSQQAVSTMIQARRQTTYKQYDSYLQPWYDYCVTHNVDPHFPLVSQAINFMANIRESRQLGYNAVNTMRSALSSVIFHPDSIPFGQRPEVKLYMKGIYNSNPPTPRYAQIWDPHTVLDFLRTWSPATKLTLRQLTLKVVFLVLLVSGQRLQTLHSLDINFMKQNTSSFTFVLSRLLKQSRPGYKNPRLTLKAYAPDKRICVYTYLDAYLVKTKSIRGNITGLFLTFAKPYHHASKDTLSRWVKEILRLSGIDTSTYGPHSVRAAASSAAKRGGASVQTILDTAGWTNNSTFARYYNRPVQGKDFGMAIMDS